MTDTPAILKAVYATWKPVPTRNVLQLVFEIPIEQTELAMKALGVPNSKTSIWCAIARLDHSAQQSASNTENGPDREPTPVPPPADAAQGQDKPRRPFREMPLSSQCALMCSTPKFIEWLGCETEAEATETIKAKLGIQSRAELMTRPVPAVHWLQIHASYELGEAYRP